MTAVEWFAEELYQKIEMKGDGKVFDELLDQAKAMEKEQIMNAWNNGFEENRPYVDHSEDYYNETFNKK